MRRKGNSHSHPENKNQATDWLLSAAIAILLLCMALPSVVKFNHAIREHKGLHCSAEARTHFHASEFDCVFHKFKLATSFYPTLFVFEAFVPLAYLGYQLPGYFLLKSREPLSYGLRAPPAFT